MKYKQFLAKLVEDLVHHKDKVGSDSIRWRILNSELVAEVYGIQVIVASIVSLYDHYLMDESFSAVHVYLQTVCKNLAVGVFTVFSDFSWVKTHLYLRMCNACIIEKYNPGILFAQFSDIVTFFYCEYETTSGIILQVIVTEDCMQFWGLDFDSIFDISVFNTQQRFPEYVIPFPLHADLTAYLLTNKQKIFGATCILYNNILQNLAALLGNDYYLLPCSVHEVLLCPSRLPVNNLSQLVNDMNLKLHQYELLSNNILKYDLQSDRITAIFYINQ